MIVKENIKKHFECDDIGSIQEYVGNKVEINSESIKLTQPVLIQSLKDEFEIPDDEYRNNPGVLGSVLPAVIEGEELGDKDMKTFRSDVGKLLFGALVSSRSMECGKRVDKIHVEGILSAFEGDVSSNEVYAWKSKPWKDFSTIWKSR
jgi:hypothetical protein